MRKLVFVLALAISLMAAMTVPVGAAELHDAHQNTIKEKCKTSEIMLWHFVNNKTGGASAGLLEVTFSDGSVVSGISPDKVLRNVQHWFVRGPAGLVTANTYLAGMLVLSDNKCVAAKNGP